MAGHHHQHLLLWHASRLPPLAAMTDAGRAGVREDWSRWLRFFGILSDPLTATATVRNDIQRALARTDANSPELLQTTSDMWRLIRRPCSVPGPWQGVFQRITPHTKWRGEFPWGSAPHPGQRPYTERRNRHRTDETPSAKTLVCHVSAPARSSLRHPPADRTAALPNRVCRTAGPRICWPCGAPSLSG